MPCKWEGEPIIYAAVAVVLAAVTKGANEWFLTVYDLPFYIFLVIG